eukprot:293170-Hanusia_phi.AAC.1
MSGCPQDTRKIPRNQSLTCSLFTWFALNDKETGEVAIQVQVDGHEAVEGEGARRRTRPPL